jgi:hypothetical protein
MASTNEKRQSAVEEISDEGARSGAAMAACKIAGFEPLIFVVGPAAAI